MNMEDKESKISIRMVGGNQPEINRVREIARSLLEALEVSKATINETLSALSSVMAYTLAETDTPIDLLKKRASDIVQVTIDTVETVRRRNLEKTNKF